VTSPLTGSIGHIKKRNCRVQFVEFCCDIRALDPLEIRLHFVLDNLSNHKNKQMRGYSSPHRAVRAAPPV
jgi:hypothetical protein